MTEYHHPTGYIDPLEHRERQRRSPLACGPQEDIEDLDRSARAIVIAAGCLVFSVITLITAAVIAAASIWGGAVMGPWFEIIATFLLFASFVGSVGERGWVPKVGAFVFLVLGLWGCLEILIDLGAIIPAFM